MTDQQDKLLNILRKVGAFISDDHFVGTNGSHFATYINKDALYLHTHETSEVCKMFAERFKDQNIEVVVGPSVGGIILSQWTAYHLSEMSGKEVLGVYTEKDAESNQVFKRNYDLVVKDKRVLIVEDLTTTGLSVKKVADTVKAAGGNVIGVCVMVNKKPDTVNSEMMGAPFSSLAEYPVEVYSAEDCPLCAADVPMNIKVGHGKKFLEAKAATESAK